MENFSFLIPLIKQYGYLVIGVGIFIECMGIPFPGETVLILAAVSASLGHLNLIAVILIAASTAILGDNAGYFLGKKFGRKILKKFEHIAFFSTVNIDKAEIFFKRDGHKTVFIARFIAILRAYSALFAGIFNMPYSTFLIYNMTGGIFWAVVIGLAGFEIGNNWELLGAILRDFQYLILTLVLGFIVYRVVNVYLKRRKKLEFQSEGT